MAVLMVKNEKGEFEEVPFFVAGGGGEGGITQVTAQMIEEALGYVPYSSKNPSGYITNAAVNGYAS